MTNDYLDTFDIVITNDGSLHTVNFLLQNMFSQMYDDVTSKLISETLGVEELQSSMQPFL